MNSLLLIQQFWWSAMSNKSIQKSLALIAGVEFRPFWSMMVSSLPRVFASSGLMDSWFCLKIERLRSWEGPEFCAHWWDLSPEREIWQSGCFYFTATRTSISPALSEGMFLPCVGLSHLWYFPHNLVPEHELHLGWDIPPFSKTSLSCFLSCQFHEFLW